MKHATKTGFKLGLLLSLMVITTACGKDDSSLELNTTVANTPSAALAGNGIGEISATQNPVLIKWTSRSDLRNFTVSICYTDIGCNDFLKIDCTRGYCEIRDARSGNLRTNHKFSQSTTNDVSRYSFTDLIYDSFGSGFSHVEVR